jgi:predicted nuclease of predicted toxin-antitoxin system
MKLLLDQNLSHRLIKQLNEHFPDSNQVSLLGMGQSDDLTIWEYAKSNSYSIVTLDADFNEYSLILDGPPLIIWLRCGNQPKRIILEKLLQNKTVIESALATDDVWCIEIY